MITYFKMTHNLAPTYLQLLVPPTVQKVSQRQLRNNTKLTVLRSRTSLYENSFIIQATKEWNSLPDSLKQIQSLPAFKTALNSNLRKIPNYFFIGNRKAKIYHTRLRLGCSSLNSDLFKNHISDNDKCICGQPETAKHFLLDCPFFNNIRSSSINKLNHACNIDILLNGCQLYSEGANEEIFLAVQNFILKSKRFS